MQKLTNSQLDTLWNIVLNTSQHGCGTWIYSFDIAYEDIAELIYIRYIEYCSGKIRLLPDGVIYLCIDTCFIDMAEWFSLVSNRISQDNFFPSIKETLAYYQVCLKLQEIKNKSNDKTN